MSRVPDDDGRLTRRQALRAGAGALAAATIAPGLTRTVASAPAATSRTTVQLLGTLAGQDARRSAGAGGRTGSAVLVRVDAALYLVDCGFGALTRLLEAGHELKDLRHLLVTRHTIDHNADLGTALLLAWSSGRNADGANAERRLGASGPPGTVRYLRNLRRQQALTIYDQASALGQTPAFGDYARAHDVNALPRRPAVAYADDLVTITAHPAFAPGPPALAYRVKTPDRDVVFTGSAGRRIDLSAFAAGADTLIHEVIDTDRARAAARTLALPRAATHRLGVERATPAVAADVAGRAGVGRLILAGVLPGSTDDDRWKALAGDAFAGPIVVGHDLITV